MALLQFFPPSSPVVSAKLHAVVLFNICDCYVRRPDQADRVIGTLLGSVSDGVVEIKNSYAVPHNESADQVALDVDYHHNMYLSHLKVNPKEVLVGWFSTGFGVSGGSALIHEFYVKELKEAQSSIPPIHLTVDTGFKNGEASIKGYVSSNLSLGDRPLAAQFQEIPLDLRMIEAERVGCTRSLEFAMQLLQLLVNQLSIDSIISENLPIILSMVTLISRQFAISQNTFKFDALHILTSLLSSNNTMFHEALRTMSSNTWAAQVHVGISEILRNRVVSAEKLQALLLADLMMSILGVNWLLNQIQLQQDQEIIPVDKFVFLLLESSRVEVAVLLNELGYLKYEPSSRSSDVVGIIIQKQQNLAISFSLIEKIIKFLANVSDAKDSSIKDSTLTKMVSGLDETINLILDFLQDSKDHGQRKGDDLLAAVRIVGSYLAEVPTACKEKTRALLGYLLSVEGQDEASPFYSICFLLPWLCQITMHIDGCKALASAGGHREIVECLLNMVGINGQIVNDKDTVFLACDTIMNVLLNRKELKDWIEWSDFVNLLHALIFWNENCKDPSVMMMVSSICCLVLDLTSEESLLSQSSFDQSSLEKLSHLIARSLNQGELKEYLKDQSDLHQIIIAGYSDWADQFPSVRNAVENS